jgi:hypothetical protein
MKINEASGLVAAARNSVLEDLMLKDFLFLKLLIGA